MLFNEVTDP